MRSIHFDPAAWDDFQYWLASDRKAARRITRSIGEIQRDPFTGIGKPEPIKGDLSGYWSRGIDDEHRISYRANDTQVKVLKARYHYHQSLRENGSLLLDKSPGIWASISGVPNKQRLLSG